ncbi:MAG: hypothetical protein QNJ40_00255 [Xanthomonadales bacterium]|nr:hypothetical protein [Xanthomonadales bacterium]
MTKRATASLSLAWLLLAAAANAPAERYSYDDAGRLASVLYDDPAATLVLYSYDDNGNLIQQVSTTDRVFDSGFES